MKLSREKPVLSTTEEGPILHYLQQIICRNVAVAKVLLTCSLLWACYDFRLKVES